MVMKSILAGCFGIWLAALPAVAMERVDNVLARMVPDGTQTLVGMRMEQLKTTPLFQKMLAGDKFSQLNEFAAETGFDPRRDVRDLLLAFNGQRAVLLARGNFHPTLPPEKQGSFKKTNYHGFEVWSNGQAGYCILDRTLAAAGPMPALQAALDQYKSGNRNNAKAILDRARSVADNYQIWGVATGNSNFITGNMPQAGKRLDFGRILQSLQNTLFEADLRKGLNAIAEGWCATPADAKSLSDAVRGAVGMGRLNTPENQPDLLRLWDGIKVEQQDRKLLLTIDIGQELIDQFLKLMQTSGPRVGPKSMQRRSGAPN